MSTQSFAARIESTVRAAKALRSEYGENPEYDRALVELTHDLVVGFTGWSMGEVRRRVLGDRPTFDDPPHHRDMDRPCYWCGSHWEQIDPPRVSHHGQIEQKRLGSMEIYHDHDCALIRWQNDQAAREE